MKRMVLNEFLSWRRRVAGRWVLVSHQTLDGLLPERVDHAVHVGEHDALVRRIAALPPKQRAVIVLRYFEDHTDQEIADLLGCRPGTVRAHASRALTALRGALTEASSAPDPPGGITTYTVHPRKAIKETR
ncbi:sigma-70 family RNA polymerase sigma factor [Actinomycetes bacterium KLBMP 9797]